MAGRLPIRRKPKIITQSKYIANFVVSKGITKLRKPKIWVLPNGNRELKNLIWNIVYLIFISLP